MFLKLYVQIFDYITGQKKKVGCNIEFLTMRGNVVVETGIMIAISS